MKLLSNLTDHFHSCILTNATKQKLFEDDNEYIFNTDGFVQPVSRDVYCSHSDIFKEFSKILTLIRV